MGQDKARLEIDGRSLLRRVYDAAESCCSRIYVVTHQPEAYRPLLPNTCLWIHETPDQGDRLFGGPLIGFAQALNHIESDWYLLLACDLPFLDPTTLNQWIVTATHSHPNTNGSYPLAWVPVLHNRWEPLCGLYHKSCKDSLQAFISSGGRSFQTWLNMKPVRALTVPDPRMLYNCNTPDDVEPIFS